MNRVYFPSVWLAYDSSSNMFLQQTTNLVGCYEFPYAAPYDDNVNHFELSYHSLQGLILRVRSEIGYGKSYILV